MKPKALLSLLSLGIIFFALPTDTPGVPRDGDKHLGPSSADRSVPSVERLPISQPALSGLFSAPVPIASSASSAVAANSKLPPADNQRGPDRPMETPKLVPSRARIGATSLGRLPLSFVENRGQFDSRVKFRLAGHGPTLWLTNQGIVFDALRAKPQAHELSAANPTSKHRPERPGSFGLNSRYAAPDTKNLEQLVFSEDFVGANAAPTLEASGRQPGIYNYFFGKDPKKWVTHVAAYSEVIYRNLWPGIDLRLYRNGTDIEQEFAVNPGGDLTKVQVAYRGIDGLNVAKDGTLVVKTAFGELRETKPRIYQEIGGQRVPVEGRFRLTGEAAYTFEVKSFQPQYALVVDPTLLYSTYLGGSSITNINGIAADSAGNAYVAGFTYSQDFPTTPGSLQPSFNGGAGDGSAFVTKLGPLGSQLVYSSYLIGSGLSVGEGIAVDSAGEAYAAGWAGDAANAAFLFPTTPNAFQTTCSASHFMAKLNAAGDGLVYSTCFGADGSVFTYGGRAMGIALDNSGHAFVAGSTGCSTPTTSGAYQPACLSANNSAIFMVEFDPTASGATSLLYGTYLGGTTSYSLLAHGTSVAVDSSGYVYVAGYTNESDFPVSAGAFQTTLRGGSNCFVSKLNTTVSGSASLIYSTYLGGSGSDQANAIAVDSLGNSYVTGQTNSSDFPATLGAFQGDFGFNGNPNLSTGFITELNASGSNVVYSSMLGNPTYLQDQATAIALDSFGHIYVTGTTRFCGFPTTPDAFQPSCAVPYGVPSAGEGWDAFVAKLNPGGNGSADLLYSSYLGGTGDDGGYGIAVDAAENVYTAGYTTSIDFPVTQGVAQPALNGSADAFITKFAFGQPQGFSIVGMTPNVGGNAGTVTTTVSGSGFQQGATVQLNCPGLPSIVGTNTIVSTDGTRITATFNLVGATPEGCSVVVTEPSGASVSQQQAFTVEQGGAPQIWVDIIGPTTVRVGKPTAFEVLYGNNGNVDALGVPVTITIPLNISINLGFSITPPPLLPGQAPVDWSQFSPIVQTSSAQMVPLFVPVIPTGQTQSLLITLTVPSGTPGHTKFTVGVSANAPYFNPAQAFPNAANCVLGIVNTALGALGLVPGLGCVPLTVAQNMYLSIVQSSIPPYQIFSNVLLGASIVTTIANCAGSLIGVGEAVAAISTAWSAYQTYLACEPIMQQLLQFQAVTPGDPNGKFGSIGVGAQQYIAGSTPLRYGVYFGNLDTASAPAQQVSIADQLDTTNDNLGTLSLGPIEFGDQMLTPPPAQTSYSTMVDLRPITNLLVSVNCSLNPSNGLLAWNFQSLDPTTMQPPTDPTVGFLPPGGEGGAFFTVMPKQGLPTNTQIQNQASIVFDVNAPISTQTWFNTLDNTPPTSSVQPLPPTEPTTGFTVNWSGTDIGAGLQDYTIYVSDNGAAFAVWQQNTTATSATYVGQLGHAYGFYSTARDLVGNVEPSKTTAEATTTVVLIAPTVTFLGAPPSAVYNTSFNVTATTNASTTAIIRAGGACSIVGNTVTMTSGTGTCGLTATWAADSTYLAASATQSTKATPAPLTIAASSGSMTYGGSPFVVGPLYSGFVNGDTGASLSTQPSCLPVFTSTTPAGTYATTCSGAVDPNYTINYQPGSVIVSQAYSAVSLASSSQASDLAGQALTFTATVNDNSPGSTGTPTGTVNFIYSGVGTIASGVPLVNGVTTFTYAPVWPGTATAVYSGDNNFTGSNSNAVGQTVTAAPIASIAPTELQFAGQDIYTTSQPQPVQISNIGTGPLNISSISITGPASDDFSLTNNCPSSLPGLALSSATPSSCTVYVSFTPDDTGVRTATLSITDNDPFSSPQLVGLTGLAQSAINSDFNRTKIVAANYIWFTAQLAVRGPVGRDATQDPVQIFFTNSTVTFNSNGVSYNLPVPNAVVVFSPTATAATTTYDTVNGRWVTTVPSIHPTKKCSVYTVDTRTFLTGFAFQVPAGGLPGDIAPVTWSGSFASDTPGISARWRWGAAVYTQFSTDYNALGVKPVEDDHETILPAWWTPDPAGTPENYKQYWIPGASADLRDRYTGDASRVVGASPAVAPLTLSATELNFGSSQVGATSTTSPMTVTVANNGAVPVTISSITVTGTQSSDFVIQSNNCASPLAPPSSSSTSPPPNVCTLSITFTPGDVGTRSGVLAITSGPDGNTQSTQTVDLGGNGTP